MADDSTLRDLFVYGTLQYPEVIHGLTGLTLKGSPARLLNYQRYAVRPPGREGRGPVIFPEAGGEVHGQILRNVPGEARELIDRFEAAGGGYERRQVQVHVETNAEPIPAWAYVGIDALREHRVGAWSEEQFEAKDLQWYLQQRLPELRSGWGLPPVDN